MARSIPLTLILPLSTVVMTALICAAQAPMLPPSNHALTQTAEYSMSHHGQTFIVMFDGKVIAEKYAAGGAADRLQMLASGSKSFVGVAAAAAVEDGILKWDELVCETLSQWKSDPSKSRITYRQLLSLTSGLRAADGGTGQLRSSTQVAWIDSAAASMTGQPGEQFQYGASQLNVFALALQQKITGETFEEYLERRILDPLGIKLDWRVRCADGNPQVGGGGFITSRDWAKFEEFVRQRGASGGKQIVAHENWLNVSKAAKRIQRTDKLGGSSEMSHPNRYVRMQYCEASGQKLQTQLICRPISSLRVVLASKGYT